MGRPRGSKNKPKTESDVSRETYPEQEVRLPDTRESFVARPASSKPAKKSWTMRAGNNWDNAVTADESPDRYHIPRDQFPEGMDLFWATRTVHGQEMTQRLNGFYRAGWTPVHKEDFDGRFASMFALDGSGYVVQEASILCARPIEMSIRAKQKEQAKAREQIALKEAAFRAGEINATGADHPSAVGMNRISRSIERIDIPKD